MVGFEIPTAEDVLEMATRYAGAEHGAGVLVQVRVVEPGTGGLLEVIDGSAEANEPVGVPA